MADVVSAPHPDPKEDDEKLVVVDIRIKHKLPRPVTLDEFKADKTFEGWIMLRIGRLSVVPVPEKMWDRIEEMAGESE